MTIGWTAKLIFFSQSLGFSCPIQLVLNGVLLIKLPTCLLSVLSSGLYISLQKHKWAENTFPIFHTTRQHVFSFFLQSHPTHPYLAACSVLWEACFGVCISCEPSRCWLVWFNQREDDGMGLRSRVLASLCSGLWDSRADGAFSLQGLFPTVTAAVGGHAVYSNSTSAFLIRPPVAMTPYGYTEALLQLSLVFQLVHFCVNNY